VSDVQTRENLAVNYGTQATHATVFTADPGTTITNELSGVTRQALSWAAGTVDGTVTASATFAIPAGTTITHAGTVSAATGGRLLDKVTAAYASQTSAGQLTVNFTYAQS
jgi:hypothetical protein